MLKVNFLVPWVILCPLQRCHNWEHSAILSQDPRNQSPHCLLLAQWFLAIYHTQSLFREPIELPRDFLAQYQLTLGWLSHMAILWSTSNTLSPFVQKSPGSTDQSKPSHSNSAGKITDGQMPVLCACSTGNPSQNSHGAAKAQDLSPGRLPPPGQGHGQESLYTFHQRNPSHQVMKDFQQPNSCTTLFWIKLS